MKPKLTLIALSLISGLISCNNSRENLQENGVFNISFDNCKTSIDLKLSDLIEDARIIPLETTQESLLGASQRFVISDDFIIILERNGIFKFSPEGQFIKKLINIGRGPNELSGAYFPYFDEKKNLLFFEDRNNPDIFKIYNIEQEQFLDPVIKWYTPYFGRYWRSFSVYNDSLIMGALIPTSVDTMPYALFLQNFKGDFVTGIKNSRKIIDLNRKTELVQRMVMSTGSEDIYVHYWLDDTLFRYKDNQLLPYVIVSYNTPRDFTRNTMANIGESRVGFPLIDNSGYMILRESTLTGFRKEETRGQILDKSLYDLKFYFLNKSDGSIALINSFTDDITGQRYERSGKSTTVLNRETLNLPVVLPGGKIYVSYQPIDLIGKDLTGIPDSDLPPGLYNHLQEIKQNLKEMDNPVLLIGTVKK